MATATFHSKIAAQAGTAAGELATKSQLDAAEAAAKSRAAHTGTQTAATISDFNAAADARVTLIVDAAPATLDTLNELAAALGDDANFSATVSGQIGALDGRLDTLEAAGGTSAFKQNIGDATQSTFTVTHNLGSRDVDVIVREVAAPYQRVWPVDTAPTINTVVVDFGSYVPATSSMRVIVRGL